MDKSNQSLADDFNNYCKRDNEKTAGETVDHSNENICCQRLEDMIYFWSVLFFFYNLNMNIFVQGRSSSMLIHKFRLHLNR